MMDHNLITALGRSGQAVEETWDPQQAQPRHLPRWMRLLRRSTVEEMDAAVAAGDADE
jgi:hypothetical protein